MRARGFLHPYVLANAKVNPGVEIMEHRLQTFLPDHLLKCFQRVSLVRSSAPANLAASLVRYVLKPATARDAPYM